jgi:LacI family transcriptional regulator
MASGKRQAGTASGCPRRVCLAVGYPSGFEDEIVRGAIDYTEHTHRWKFVGRGHRPFMPFEEIDLSAVDGVIGLLSRSAAEAIRKAGVAAVNCSTRDADLPLPRVGNDDAAIGRMGAAHLLARGFAHFGFVRIGNTWYGEQRLRAFRQVIEEAGRTCQVLADVEDTREVFEPAMRQWLAEVARPIGVMAINDSHGLNLIQAAGALGLRVPDDVAVLGVDNDRWATAMSPVALSSVAIDARQIGTRAAELLDRLMDGEPAPPPQWIPPIAVVTRQSTDITVAEDPQVAMALAYMRDHCGEGITVDDVLMVVGGSRRSLEMRLKRATGQTPQAAIFAAQIERAKRLLVHSNQMLGPISRACGFGRQEQFSRVFKRLTGLTPGQYRRQRGGRLP